MSWGKGRRGDYHPEREGVFSKYFFEKEGRKEDLLPVNSV